MPRCQSAWVLYQHRPCALLSDAVHKSLGCFLSLRGLETLGWKLCKSYKTMTSCESGWILEFTYSGLPCILEDYFGPVSSAIGPLLASRRNHWKYLLNFAAVSETCEVTKEMRGYIATAFRVPCPQSLCPHATLLNLSSLHLSPWPHPGPLGDPVQYPWFNILIASVLENAKPCNDQRMKQNKTKQNTPKSVASWAFYFQKV